VVDGVSPMQDLPLALEAMARNESFGKRVVAWP
jgi:hypothetical protein